VGENNEGGTGLISKTSMVTSGGLIASAGVAGLRGDLVAWVEAGGRTLRLALLFYKK
jgi:hypothetical protein